MLEANEIEIGIDIFGFIYVKDACRNDFYNNRLSTYERIKEELLISNYNEIFSDIKEPGVYIMNIEVIKNYETGEVLEIGYHFKKKEK